VLALMRRPMTILINQDASSTIGFKDDVGRGVLKNALTRLSHSFGSPG
jgi:hypothetical protein